MPGEQGLVPCERHYTVENSVFWGFTGCRWAEEDDPVFGGNSDNITINIDLEFEGQGFGANVTFPRGNGDDYIGTTIVDKNECIREYSVGVLRWRLAF